MVTVTELRVSLIVADVSAKVIWKARLRPKSCRLAVTVLRNLGYATPIVHASQAAPVPARRRVLQVDFAAVELPGGLEWLGV